MGIFDRLKQVGNYITGGSAKVHLEVDDSMVNSEGRILLNIYCLVKDSDINVDRLYVKIKSVETIRYYDANYGGSHTGHTRSRGTNRSKSVTTYKNEIIVDENFRLDANGEYEWSAEMLIPKGIASTYRGVNARHEWQVNAGLAKKGNDPSSGWVIFNV